MEEGGEELILLLNYKAKHSPEAITTIAVTLIAATRAGSSSNNRIIK